MEYLIFKSFFVFLKITPFLIYCQRTHLTDEYQSKTNKCEILIYIKI